MPVVLGNTARDSERFRVMLAEDTPVVDSAAALADFLERHPEEDLVIIGPDIPMTAVSELADNYRLSRPSLGLVLVRRRVDVPALSDALRVGIREVVAADDAEALQSATTRSRELSRRQRAGVKEAGPTTSRGKVILVFSAKGGCGKTTVATNLADALSTRDGARVCLVDFNLEFGDVAIALQIDPVRTMSDALGMQGGLDRHGISSLVINYKEQFDVLLAPTRPADAEFISAALAAEILDLLAEMYDFVVIDSPPAFNDIILRCFDLADTYVLLTTLDMLALKNFKITLDTLDTLGYPRARWRVVLNRGDSHAGLTASDVESVIGLPVSSTLPINSDVPASLNRGVPLTSESPRNPFSRAVTDLANATADGTPIGVGSSSAHAFGINLTPWRS